MRILLIALLLVLAPSRAWAWGEDGHSIVAEVAQHRLSKPSLDGVAALLGNGWSLASVSSWADDERNRDIKTKRWHFVDMPETATTYDATRDCVLNVAEGDCAVAAIEREAKVVACATQPMPARVRALKFLVHFVGDLHQPLHATGVQEGGNKLNVTIVTKEGINGNVPFNTNLHSAWDAALIQKTAWSWGNYVERLETSWLMTPEASAAAVGTPAQWATESHAIANILTSSVPVNGVLDDQYRKDHLEMLDRQLGRGGVRLAMLLNQAFAMGSCP